MALHAGVDIGDSEIPLLQVRRRFPPCGKTRARWQIGFSLGAPLDPVVSKGAVRGFAFGAALYRNLGWEFAGAFAVLLTGGQVFAYSRGMRPAMDYAATGKPRLTRRLVWGILVRTVGYAVTALLCSALVQHVDHAWRFAIRVGLVIGIVTGFGSATIPLIEYYADNLPERRLGAFGIVLIFCGFALQSFQYWVALLDVRVT